MGNTNTAEALARADLELRARHVRLRADRDTLLAALKAVMESYVKMRDAGLHGTGGLSSAIDQARAAIERAEVG